MEYIINEKTFYLMEKYQNIEIIEEKQVIKLKKSILSLIDENCKYYGSSYQGRKSATKYLIGITSKRPIFLSEKKNILLFPIYSERSQEKKIWFVYNNILKYRKVKKYVEVTFKNGETYLFLISFNVFKNQFLKTSELLAIMILQNS